MTITMNVHQPQLESSHEAFCPVHVRNPGSGGNEPPKDAEMQNPPNVRHLQPTMLVDVVVAIILRLG